jgi:hypothetical protein
VDSAPARLLQNRQADRLYHPIAIALCRRYSAHRRRAAAAILALPSGVLAPVDIPPCNLQRPFASAWHWHGVPRHVLAPHFGRSRFGNRRIEIIAVTS